MLPTTGRESALDNHSLLVLSVGTAFWDSITHAGVHVEHTAVFLGKGPGSLRLHLWVHHFSLYFLTQIAQHTQYRYLLISTFHTTEPDAPNGHTNSQLHTRDP